MQIWERKIVSIFGVEPRPGLSNYLSGYYENQESVNIDKYLKQTDVNNLYIIPAGNIPPNPSELLVRRQMRNLLEQLKNQVDLVNNWWNTIKTCNRFCYIIKNSWFYTNSIST